MGATISRLIEMWLSALDNAIFLDLSTLEFTFLVTEINVHTYIQFILKGRGATSHLISIFLHPCVLANGEIEP